MKLKDNQFCLTTPQIARFQSYNIFLSMKQLAALMLLLVATTPLLMSHMQLPPGYFYLSLQIAPNQNQILSTSGIALFWNGILLTEYFGADYGRYSMGGYVPIEPGENYIDIMGTGQPDGKGMGIDKVSLTDGIYEYTQNGDFEQGHSVGDSVTGVICLTGWKCNQNQLKIGAGYRWFNKLWPTGTTVVDLDMGNNAHIRQTFKFDQNLNFLGWG